MPGHYSAGWWMDSSTTVEEAAAEVHTWFLALKRVAATRNVLLPVGTDYTPPNKWIMDIQREWNARYVWPRFVCGCREEFFAAVRAQEEAFLPQTRDMNPVYTGKDVSFIDTKQVQRRAETLVADAEKFATLASVEKRADYPFALMDKAWRQLVYGAHHDAITGSESDQVYLDLLTGWREAYTIGSEVLDGALRTLGAGLSGVVVWNPSSWPRTDIVRVRVRVPHRLARDRRGGAGRERGPRRRRVPHRGRRHVPGEPTSRRSATGPSPSPRAGTPAGSRPGHLHRQRPPRHQRRPCAGRRGDELAGGRPGAPPARPGRQRARRPRRISGSPKFHRGG